MDNKMTAMNKHFAEDGAFTAVDGIGDEYEQKDTTGSGYNDEERQRIDAVNAERLRQLKAEEDLRERQRANRTVSTAMAEAAMEAVAGASRKTSTPMPVSSTASRTAAWNVSGSTRPNRTVVTRKRKPRKDGSGRR